MLEGFLNTDVLFMEADYYQGDFERRSNCDIAPVPLGIAANSEIKNAIIDKNAHIGCNVKILNKDSVEEADRESESFYIRNGIVIVLERRHNSRWHCNLDDTFLIF